VPPCSRVRDYLAFGDIEGKLDMLRVECTRCPRTGRYSVAKLIGTYGRDGNNMADWSSGLKQDCPRRNASLLAERCDLICPDLPKVLRVAVCVQASRSDERMKIIEKLPQLITGVSFLVLTLAIVHEISYFALVGPQFQSLMSATDYLVSALSWMPLLGVVLFLTALATAAFARWTEGRTHDEMISTSKAYRRFAYPAMNALFGSTTVFAVAITILLFGNPYVLNASMGLASFGAVTFLFWLKKFEPFGRILTFPVFLIASGLPVLLLLAFVTGRSDAYYDLTFRGNVHAMRLKNSLEAANAVVLRLLAAGVLARKPDEHEIQFYRWDQIETLSVEFTPLDSRSLVCRLLNWSCPPTPAVPKPPPQETPAPNDAPG
jgi:hypothetical protein